MSITMQGSWNVQVKAKWADRPQRFVISGAASGNGNYNGVTGTSVFVTGSHWTITIQNNPGSGFVSSKERIQFPTTTPTLYQFDILSDDGGGSDEDFNDLVLTCSTARTDTDFIIYGNVSYYSGRCWFNPCRRRWLIIDTLANLAAAVKNPVVRDAVEKLYPHRLIDLLKPNPNPPDPGPDFKPLLIPLEEEVALPPKLLLNARTKQVESEVRTTQDKKAAAEKVTVNQLTSFSSAPASQTAQSLASVNIDRIALSNIRDKFRFFCETGTLPFAILNFQEYDRSGAELAGAPYSGSGDREDLGLCTADENGNYIFRFQRSVAQFIAEASNDTAAGENASQQMMPDIIAQLMQATNTNQALYETTPYFNVPFLQRIDLCIPKEKTGLIPFPCNGQSIIQRVGNIVVGPLVGGIRDGVGNYLTANGIITATHFLAPAGIRCSAWAGNLAIWGCLSESNIRYYTVRYKKHSDPDLPSSWKFIPEGLAIPKFMVNPVTHLKTDLVNMSVSVTVPLKVDGAALAPTPAFNNLETDPDPDWMNSMRNLKAFVNSNLYTSVPAPMDFKMEGYLSSGDPAPLAREVITLFIDNSAQDMLINPNVEMAGVTLGNCALFKLPEGQTDTPLTITYRSVLLSGFMNAYQLYMNKGAIGGFAITPASGEVIANDFGFTTAATCGHTFQGTIDEPTADGAGNYTVHVRPTSGRWLDAAQGTPGDPGYVPEQTFCAFGINLSASLRRTDGSSSFPGYYANQVLIGIQK